MPLKCTNTQTTKEPEAKLSPFFLANPCIHQPNHSSRHPQRRNLPHLILPLPPNLIRNFPPHLYPTAVPTLDTVQADILRDAVALVGREGDAGLMLELELCALVNLSVSIVCISII